MNTLKIIFVIIAFFPLLTIVAVMMWAGWPLLVTVLLVGAFFEYFEKPIKNPSE